MNNPPSDVEGLRLYRALLQPSPSASLDFARAYLFHLTEWLRAKFPTVSADFCEEAAVEAMYGLLSGPQRFEEGRGSLLSYLHLAAKRDLLNVLRREQRHGHEPLDEKNVALQAERGNYSRERQNPLQILCAREEDEHRQAFLQEVRSQLPAQEQPAFDLLVAGERRTTAFAESLGLAHLPAAEQRAEVKRFKNRLKLRLKRRKDRQ